MKFHLGLRCTQSFGTVRRDAAARVRLEPGPAAHDLRGESQARFAFATEPGRPVRFGGPVFSFLEHAA